MSTSVVTERSGRSVGRTVGVLLLLHLAAGLTVPFMLLQPLIAPPGFLANGAGIPNGTRGWERVEEMETIAARHGIYLAPLYNADGQVDETSSPVGMDVRMTAGIHTQ